MTHSFSHGGVAVHCSLTLLALPLASRNTDCQAGPEWEGSLPRVKRYRCRKLQGNSLSTRHTAGKMQELACALRGAWALLALSTFSQAKSLLSLLLPPALAHFRNLAKVSDNVIFNLLQAGLGSHVRSSEGTHAWSEHQPHGQWMGALCYTPLHATQTGCWNVSPLALHFERCVWQDSKLTLAGTAISVIIN